MDETSPPEGIGPYLTGYINVYINRTSGGLLLISIYYPALSGGWLSAPNTTAAPYPAILFGTGFLSTVDNYRDLAAKIASWGFAFTIVGTAPGVWNPERATDMLDALNWIDEQNDNSSFSLYGMMDKSKYAAMGHSLGAEAAIILSSSDSRLKALIPIAPFISPPGSTAILSASIHFPMLIVVGSSDTIAPPSTMAYELYGYGNNPKFCITIINEDHLTIVPACPKYVVSFLKFYFYGDQDYARYLYGLDAQQEALDGKILLTYDLRTLREYEVLFKQIPYNVSVYSDSTFLSLYYNETENVMNFTLTGPPHTTGTTTISIPKPIVDGYYVVFLYDGEPYPSVSTNNSLSYIIDATYNHSQHQISILFDDRIPPTLSIASPQAGSLLNYSDVEATWTGQDNESGIDHFEVKLDDGAWLNVGNDTSRTYTELVDGNHTIQVAGFDKAGNDAMASVSFIVDSTPPTLSITSPSVGSALNFSSTTLAWSCSDTVSGVDRFDIKVDDGTWLEVGNVTHYDLDLSDGNHTVSLKAFDNAQNAGETSVDFLVDTEPPAVLIFSPLSDSVVRSPNLTVSWSGQDAVSGILGYDLRLDAGDWMDMEINDSYILTELTSGNHTIYVRARDKAGNLRQTEGNFSIDLASAPALLWTEWWFWAIVGAIIVFCSATTIQISRSRRTRNKSTHVALANKHVS